MTAKALLENDLGTVALNSHRHLNALIYVHIRPSIGFANGLSTMISTTHRNVSTVVVAISIAALSLGKGQAEAAGSDWGCEVLLCAASENPSWHGVPYCFPPMRKLIAAMATPFFSWPICVGAGTGAPGHEPYDDCPSGFTPTRSSDGSDGRQPSDYDRCFRRVDTGLICHSPRGGIVDCSQVEIVDRPQRAKPYFFDIRQLSGEMRRFWFDLHD
ncbi:hypothetical protein [Rhizobium sp. C4]|uniref:hypothetical protein n=1 Tax=Rhizobium sp. C4 TaxID=1349800 RepID=UPI001E3A4FFA|nr:hypothetical protein [Rhizobium sp. C4]MCD2174953.1 hypothetical protein [Rhizobium sp. C4]